MCLTAPTLTALLLQSHPPGPVFLSANRAVQVFRLPPINKGLLYNLSIGFLKVFLYPVDLMGSECFLQDVECFQIKAEGK